MANQADIYAARDRATARARIEQIYANRGVPVPSNIDRLVARAMSDPNYFDQVRVHAANDAQALQRPAAPPLTSLPGGRGPQDTAGHAKDAAIGLVGGGGSLGDDDAIRAEIRRIWNELTGGAMIPSGALLEQYVQIVKRHGHYNRVQEMASKWGGGGRRSTGGGGGGPAAGGPDSPGSGYTLGDARALFPWMPEELLRIFFDKWDELGPGQEALALAHMRQHEAYKRHFPGIRRADGTLRMSEEEYFSTRVGFSEALAEFGFDPVRYQKSFVRLFENEVDARELFAAAQEAVNRFVEPGGQRGQLADLYLDRFIDSGSAVRALEAVRSSDQYDKTFVGNRRGDGTLRMDEPDYFAYKRGWQRTLAGFGLDPTFFEARGRFRQSVEHEISIDEVGGRLQTVQDGIIDNMEQVQRFYADNYELRMTPEAILGQAIDPELQRDVLERRVQASQIGGEAALQGFRRSVERAETLARAGVSQGQARQLYSEAGYRLPGMGATTRRFFRGDFGLGEYEDVFALGNAGQQTRLQRALASEQSQFTSRADVRRTREGFGLSGLQVR